MMRAPHPKPSDRIPSEILYTYLDKEPKETDPPKEAAAPPHHRPNPHGDVRRHPPSGQRAKEPPPHHPTPTPQLRRGGKPAESQTFWPTGEGEGEPTSIMGRPEKSKLASGGD